MSGPRGNGDIKLFGAMTLEETIEATSKSRANSIRSREERKSSPQSAAGTGFAYAKEQEFPREVEEAKEEAQGTPITLNSESKGHHSEEEKENETE